MPALTHNITIEKAADFQREFIVTDPNTGLPYDFDGYSGVAPLTTRAGVAIASFAVSFAPGIVLIALTPQGQTNLVISSNYNYKYKVTVSSPTDPDFRIAEGSARVK